MKNFASLYASANPVIALSQKFFIKEEVTRGTMVAPLDGSFIWHLEGASINFSQPKSSSPHKSGRHNTDVILEKKSGEFSLPLFFNVDTAAVQGVAEVDQGVRTLMKSMFGKEDTTAGVKFTSVEDPSITFSMFENGDKFAKQGSGCVVESCNMEFPGDGQAKMTFDGRVKNVLNVGIGKSVTANAANTVTLGTATEAKRFPIGAMVMIIEANGTTRSADTPNGSPRIVTASDPVTGIVTLDGAVLADADGTVTPVYLCYYEPATPTGINNPLTGLKGTVTVDNVPAGVCFRSVTVNCVNNHEYVDYCFGKDTLGDDIFVAGGRLQVDVTLETNLNAKLIEYINDKGQFVADEVELVLGDAAGRHFKIALPKVIYDVPAITIPASGSVPISMAGMALQTGLDVGDEIEASYL